MVDPLSLYFHIPFCRRKCPYCHFYVIPDRESHRSLLLRSLLLEIASLSDPLKNHRIVSIYFGGGTPSLFGVEPVGTLLKTLFEKENIDPDCEITLEANPEDVTEELIRGYKQVGINRISLGVQSLDESSLQILERTHTAQKAMQAIRAVKKAGVDNLSIDLMYDLPDQSVESFQKTLHKLEELPITHVSLYNLTIEPHTSFSKRKKTLQLPKEEESYQMLSEAVSHLESIGLRRYEISAFARSGYLSRHNIGYWTGRPFFGLGPSAFSYYKGARFRNVAHINRYAKAVEKGKSPIDFEEKLPYPQNLQERLAVELRLIEGVDIADFSFPQSLEKTVRQLVQKGYLSQSKTRLKLSKKGLLFYDIVASEIV